MYYQAKLAGALPSDIKIFVLYAGVSDDVSLSFLYSCRGGRFLVLSTNYAESSCTIPGVEAVIDFCKEKRRTRDGLKQQHISQASCQQRRGRACRQCPGYSLKMMRKADY